MIHDNELTESTASAPSTPSKTITDACETPKATTVSAVTVNSPTEIGLTRTPESRIFASVSISDEDDGYDSDGAIGPFFDQVEGEDAIDYNEEELSVEHESTLEGSAQVDMPMEPDSAQDDIWTEEDVRSNKYKVKDMQLFLKDRGVKCSGLRKAQLVEKVVEAIKNKTAKVTQMNVSVRENLAEGQIFTPGSFWKEISATGEELDEDGLNVEGEQFHAPTNAADEVVTTKKRNFGEQFDRPVFTGEFLGFFSTSLLHCFSFKFMFFFMS